MSMLAQLPGVVPVWEPFHRTKGVVPRRWGARPVASTLSVQDLAHLRDVFSGRKHNAWTCSRSSMTRAWNAHTLLFKHVRANHLLTWLLAEGPLDSPPILLVRHPWDIAVSQVKAFGARGRDLDVHDVFPGHHELHHHWPELTSLKDPLVRQLHIWCLLNARVVQDNAQRHDVVLVHYHDLVLSPKQELARIVHALGWQPRDKGWEIDAYLDALDPNRASDTDFRGERKAEATEQLWKNQTGLSQERLQKLQAVLDVHGYTLHRMGAIAPLKKR